jgi:hypothetical protein
MKKELRFTQKADQSMSDHKKESGHDRETRWMHIPSMGPSTEYLGNTAIQWEASRYNTVQGTK